MHLFYSASQTIKNGYLGRLICHIFGIFTVNFGLSQSKWHGFPNLLGPFQGPNRFVALLPQSDKTSQNHNEYRMLRVIVRENRAVPKDWGQPIAFIFSAFKTRLIRLTLVTLTRFPGVLLPRLTTPLVFGQGKP